MKTILTLVAHAGRPKLSHSRRAKSIGFALVFVLLAGSAIPVYGQFGYIISDLVPIDSQSGDVVYQGRGHARGASTVDLYSRAQAYFKKTLRPGSVVDLPHHSKRIVRESGILTLNVWTAGAVQPQSYRVSIEVKVQEGRYRYEFSRFAAQPDSVRGNLPIRALYPSAKRTFDMDEQSARTLQSWDRSVRAYIAGFKHYMAQPSVDQ
ncbi:hypothetical protein [Spirosoma linguale]|uniref:DUF4468 domain-containing protein n=1 Tax=Spirosoma linguale (strain ATCC 33905 / DSM 74 / LMG 10896 / Claus 1) TaxID=504472 RepID=D2QVB2_SPILD|nr:hypothetical protein Slin_6794 [Spirosoma linguale DSM 74]